MKLNRVTGRPCTAGARPAKCFLYFISCRPLAPQNRHYVILRESPAPNGKHLCKQRPVQGPGRSSAVAAQRGAEMADIEPHRSKDLGTLVGSQKLGIQKLRKFSNLSKLDVYVSPFV